MRTIKAQGDEDSSRFRLNECGYIGALEQETTSATSATLDEHSSYFSSYGVFAVTYGKVHLDIRNG